MAVAPEQEAPKVNLWQRLAAIRREVSYIQKDKKVESYMAVTHDTVTAMVRPHFDKHGVLVVPELLQQATIDTGRRTKSGTPIFRHEVVYKIKFISIDDPVMKEEVVVSAHADDQGDKGPGKALSYAVKMAYLKILQIETGENEESRFADVRPAGLPEEDRVAMLEAVESAKDAATLKGLWTTSAAKCRELRDEAAYKMIKAAVEEKNAELKASKL